MYKNILLAMIIAIFAGCSAPKPAQKPAWFTSPPKDFKNFYAIGSGETKHKAKNVAIASLREQINFELDASFKKKNHKLAPIDKAMLEQIMTANSHLCNRLSMRGIKIAKTDVFNGKTLVLITLSKKETFDKLTLSSEVKLKAVKQAYSDTKNEIAIKRFIALKPLIEKYPSLASLTGCRNNIIASRAAGNDFKFLKKMYNDYIKLKSEINFYILSDADSRIFSSSIKNAIKKEGLSVENSLENKESVKLLITSKTADSKDYSFMQSKSLIKFTTFDIDKDKIAFRQHTFIGKSRKNYKEAKAQAAIHVKAKVRKLGVFDFIGLQNK